VALKWKATVVSRLDSRLIACLLHRDCDNKGHSNMAMMLTILRENAILHAIAAGRFSVKHGQASFLQMLDASKQHNLSKILFDGRQLKGSLDTIERFLYGKFAAQAVAQHVKESGAAHVPQFAYVLHEPVLDPRRFGETVAVNRGMWVKAFDNLEAALEWLASTPADRLASR
jgi:hypothetical protein